MKKKLMILATLTVAALPLASMAEETSPEARKFLRGWAMAQDCEAAKGEAVKNAKTHCLRRGQDLGPIVLSSCFHSIREAFVGDFIHLREGQEVRFEFLCKAL